MATPSRNLRDLAEAIQRGEKDVIKEFNERSAITTLRDSGQLPHLPWRGLRRGDPGKKQPDWVLVDERGNIAAGFEVTELAFTMARLVNAKLDVLKRSGRPASPLETAKESDRLADHAFSMVEHDSNLVCLQQA